MFGRLRSLRWNRLSCHSDFRTRPLRRLTAASLDVIERFFLDPGAQVDHEVSQFVGIAALSLLCARQYRPIEISNVIYRPTERPAAAEHGNIRVRVTGPEDAQLWIATSTKGWTHEHPELLGFFLQTTTISSAREQSPCFLAEFDGQPGAAGSLFIHNGVALFAGAATIPEMRRRGLQAALLQERMRYAFDHGCDLAMMVAEAGSDFQRNAERKGFQIAYTHKVALILLSTDDAIRNEKPSRVLNLAAW
jgi:GNAT superfamily N-acetyltransferase